MRILVLQGSPNSNGSTAKLVEEFGRGAREAGHDVRVLDVANMNVAPCMGCVACGFGGLCVQADDFDEIRELILSSDMLVLATPLYYYGMSAQLKTVIDRFCAANPFIHERNLHSALLTVAWNADDWTFDALEAHYDTLVRYLNMRDRGRVLGRGCGTPSMTSRSGYLERAYELGRSL